jgi:hypothetical protein
MAGGATVPEARGGRRTLDSEINMIPMIDLLMVTISFLLITAVWTHLARVDASAMAPHEPGLDTPAAVPRLHVDMRDDARFVLRWNEGPTVVRSTEIAVPANERGRDPRFPELSAALASEWRTRPGGVEPGGPAALVLHTRNDTPYATMIAAIDAAHAVTRPGAARGGGAKLPAYLVTLAVD